MSFDMSACPTSSAARKQLREWIRGTELLRVAWRGCPGGWNCVPRRTGVKNAKTHIELSLCLNLSPLLRRKCFVLIFPSVLFLPSHYLLWALACERRRKRRHPAYFHTMIKISRPPASVVPFPPEQPGWDRGARTIMGRLVVFVLQSGNPTNPQLHTGSGTRKHTHTLSIHPPE